MNTDTFEIYRGEEAINAALKRGEPLIEVPEKVANGNRAQRRRYAQDLARAQKAGNSAAQSFSGARK